MDEPIISPWILLLIDKIGDVDALANFGFAISFGMLMISILVWWIKEGISEAKGKALKVMRLCAIFVSIFGAACLLLPSKMTCYKMLAASYATPNNIQIATDKTVDFIERLAEAINKGRQE